MNVPSVRPAVLCAAQQKVGGGHRGEETNDSSFIIIRAALCGSQKENGAREAETDT